MGVARWEREQEESAAKKRAVSVSEVARVRLQSALAVFSDPKFRDARKDAQCREIIVSETGVIDLNSEEKRTLERAQGWVRLPNGRAFSGLIDFSRTCESTAPRGGRGQ